MSASATHDGHKMCTLIVLPLLLIGMRAPLHLPRSSLEFIFKTQLLANVKNFTQIVPGNPFVGGVKHKRCNQNSDFGPIESYISETVQDRR